MGEHEQSPLPANQPWAPLELVVGGDGDTPSGPGGFGELRLPASRSSARAARHWVMNELAADGVFGAENQIIELLTGEVVANAVLHGPADGLIRVRVRRTDQEVRVAVRDDSVAIPVVRHPAPSAPTGRGLALVDSLSARWGIERHGSQGKTVWFSVDLDPV